MFSYLDRLRHLDHCVDVVLDTDAYNEIDDQFAMAYLIKSPQRANVKEIYAAPYFNKKSTGPADGMEKSYNEIIKILSLMERDDLKKCVYKGSTTYLPNEETPVISPAAEALAKLASKYTKENPLYVIALAAITNVASALLINPDIKDKIVVVWLGGHAMHMDKQDEFNLRQDIAAARIVFGCGVALVQLPCLGVATDLTTTGPELEYWLKGKNALCDYLVQNTIEEAESYASGQPWSRVIWDVTAVAWLINDEFTLDRLEHSPIPTYDNRYCYDNSRHFIRYVYFVERDKVFGDMFKKLSDNSN